MNLAILSDILEILPRSFVAVNSVIFAIVLSHFLNDTVLSHFLIAIVLSHSSLI
jgi:hypothetical protein